ncbi:FAD-dependent oxidoreductase [Paenibacillus sediminis]|uniref:NADH dehydrogenase n=1 Tax=Paenibacillus sediminis TaxID=664909 RepID=A0ABS4H626_9BACL|nr:FAD-dependent oxidoreductase [Paenibacillus sediminis]MBP1937926.1 NADH dehydrogenase [Paenibacillus sediminis]
MQKFVILGGGYGGLALIDTLFKGDIPLDTTVILVDRMPFQGLKTEYYALAAGTASDHELRVPFPSYPGLQIKYGDVTSIDPDNRLIYFHEDDPLEYDQLAIALGCTDCYHNIPGADAYTASIQSFSSTRRTYQLLNDVKPYGHVNIVGGGLSGIEVAAELRESRPDLNINILDRGPHLLSSFPNNMSQYVEDWFREHDVNTLSNISVSRVEQGAVYNRDEEIISDVTVWTAGIEPVKVVKDLNVPKDNKGRIVINEYHQIPEHPEVYVIGDCASLPYAPSAQIAGLQGKQIGHIVQALWKNETPRLYPLKTRGTLGSLGKKAGFGLMGKRSVVGFVPRLLKSGVLWKSKRHFG